MNHRPRKRFGQNFLQDQAIIEQIISSLHLKKEDAVIEIGPGRGALTAPLLFRLNALTAIEIDRDLHALLKTTLIDGDKLTLISADALSVDYSQFGNDLRLIGNLPYNISTPLLLHLLKYHSSIIDLHFMLQKEVVDRLAARPCTKDYGRLSVMIQYHCAVTHLFDVPPTAFYPIPKVSSAIVRLKPYKESPFPAVNFNDLEMIVGKAFGMRRKTLANNLKGLLDAHTLEALNIDPKQRPEQIPVEDFVKMALALNTKAP